MSIPSSLGMLVYRDLTSSVTSHEFGGMLGCILNVGCKKWVVPFIYEAFSSTIGLRF